MLYCMCTGMKCNNHCLCYRFCLPYCELCFRHASPNKKERTYQHVLEHTESSASDQYMGQWAIIKAEMENKI